MACAGFGGWGITLAPGDDDTGNDFGNCQKATKTGMKFHDLNANGVKDAGEPGLAGWTITAYADTNGNGIRDAAETTRRGVRGDGCERRLQPEPEPRQVRGLRGAAGELDPVLPAPTRVRRGPAGGWAITLTSGQLDAGNDFGNYQKATKTGTKFNDLNANGVKDAGEPGLGGLGHRAYADTNGDGTPRRARRRSRPRPRPVRAARTR